MRISFALSALLCLSVAAAQDKNPQTDSAGITPATITLSAQKEPRKCIQKFTIDPENAKAAWSLDPSDPASGTIDATGCYTVPKMDDKKPAATKRVTVIASVDGKPTAKATIVLMADTSPRAIQIKGTIFGTEKDEKKCPHDANIRLTDPEGKVIGYDNTKEDGSFSMCAPVLLSQKYNLVVGTEGHRKVPRELDFTGMTGCPASAGCTCPEGGDYTYTVPPVFLESTRNILGEYARAIVGFEQVAASSAKSERKFFSNLFLTTPMPFPGEKRCKDKKGKNNSDARKPGCDENQKDADRPEPRLRLWGDVRASSIPQSTNAALGTFATSFLANFANVPVNQLVSSLEFLGGFEFRLPGQIKRVWGFGNSEKQNFSWSVIASAGAITAQVPEEAMQYFQIPDSRKQDISDKFGVTTPYIIFAPEGRNRFLRQYYAGLRFKTTYTDRYGNVGDRFPAMVDISYGLNEAVTGGSMHGGVFRIDGYYPLPWDKVRYLSLFATALLKPSRSQPLDMNQLNSILNLTPVDAPTKASPLGGAVTIYPVRQMDRDYYRVGVGVDAIALLNFIRDSTTNKGSK